MIASEQSIKVWFCSMSKISSTSSRSHITSVRRRDTSSSPRSCPVSRFQGLKVTVPAVQAKLGGHTCYTFAIAPEYLLKIAYVARRTTRSSDVGTYQAHAHSKSPKEDRRVHPLRSRRNVSNKHRPQPAAGQASGGPIPARPTGSRLRGGYVRVAHDHASLQVGLDN